MKCGEKKWREKIFESFSDGEVKPESLKRIEEMTGTEVTFYLADMRDKRQLQQVFDKVRKWYDRCKSNFKSIISNKWYILSRGGFRGGGAAGGGGIRPPADPKGPPFDTFSEIHFWQTDPKIFLKAPSAPIYSNFEGERAPKKRDFFCQNFSKTAFFNCFFFKNLPAAQKNLAK